MALIAAAVLPGAAGGQTSEAYTLVEGSTFQRGCFEPCECPIGQERPLVGTFALRFRSDNGLFAEYDMLDVHWNVKGSAYATPTDAAITGAGSYTVGGEFAVEQRMEADLAVADEPPAPFDSGRVFGGGGFPDQIDVEMSRNGKVCFDTVMHVVATRSEALPEPRSAWPLLVGALLALVLARRRIARSSAAL